MVKIQAEIDVNSVSINIAFSSLSSYENSVAFAVDEALRKIQKDFRKLHKSSIIDVTATVSKEKPCIDVTSEVNSNILPVVYKKD